MLKFKSIFIIIFLFLTRNIFCGKLAAASIVSPRQHELKSPRLIDRENKRKAYEAKKAAEDSEKKEVEDSIETIVFRIEKWARKILKSRNFKKLLDLINSLVEDFSKANEYLHKLDKKIKENLEEQDQKEFNKIFMRLDSVIKRLVGQKVKIVRKDNFELKIGEIHYWLESKLDAEQKIYDVKILLDHAFDYACVEPGKYFEKLLSIFDFLRSIKCWDAHIALKQKQLEQCKKGYDSESGLFEILLKRMNAHVGVFFTLEFYLHVLKGKNKGIYLNIRA